MEKFRYKEDEVDIELHSMDSLARTSAYTSLDVQPSEPGRNFDLFEGFELWRPDDSPPAETGFCVEPHGKFKIEEQDGASRMLVLSIQEQIRGLLVLNWVHDRVDYWYYYFSKLDIHKDFQDQGLAILMIKKLKELKCLESRILKMPYSFTRKGTQYLEKMLYREMGSSHMKVLDRMSLPS